MLVFASSVAFFGVNNINFQLSAAEDIRETLTGSKSSSSLLLAEKRWNLISTEISTMLINIQTRERRHRRFEIEINFAHFVGLISSQAEN